MKLGLPPGDWREFEFPDAGQWARWSERQQRRWLARARGSSGVVLLRRVQPFHPAARPRVAQAYGLVGRLHREAPTFWLDRVPPLTDRGRGSEAMALLRRAESELRQAADPLALAVCLDLEAALLRGTLDDDFEAASCGGEAAELAERGGWEVLAALERVRGELWEGWWAGETGGDGWGRCRVGEREE